MQIELGANVIGYGANRGSEPPKAAAGCGFRHVLLVFGCLANVIGYSDRSNLSLAIIPMSCSLHLSSADQGLALGAFFIGYACTQVLGGFLALLYGSKPVLLLAVALWSLATVLTPPLASLSLPLLVAARIAIGLGEGLLLPCLHALASKWVPRTERATAAAGMTSGQFMGTVVALLCGPLAAWWWPSVFLLFGGAGVVWCAFFALLASSTPQESAWVRPAELVHIRGAGTSSTSEGVGGADDDTRKLAGGGGGSSSGAAPTAALRSGLDKGRVASVCAAVPWRRLLFNRGTGAIFVAHATHNWGWYLLLSWLPKMLADQLAADAGGPTAGHAEAQQLDCASPHVASAGLLALLPHLAAFVMSNSGGFVADRVLLPRVGLTHTSKLMQLAAQLGPCAAFTIFAINPAPGAALTSLLSTVAIACGALMQSGCWANVLDVAPAHAGVLLGISNTIATFPGVICNLAAGYFLEAGFGWRPIFVLSAAFELIGALTFTVFGTAEVLVR